MIPAVILVVFPFAMAYAAFSDLVSMTIANRVSVVLVLAFTAVALAIGMPLADIAQHFGVAAICLVVTFGCFALGWMGGGDAKLIAATALWFGPTTALVEYFLWGSVFGGILTLGLLAVRGTMAPVTGVDFFDHLLQSDTGIPYGIGLGAAGLFVYSSSDWVALAVRGVV
ncbi:peptidase [Aureimonas sp. SA4125]|uniref:A24 family peptidase n=1 Tax=Aureimonas sp. SA4125 TaxID=2826993 RepID=UPI001CC72F90|nr:prepilin peptidase [Aureimonas sp. SA4125]BDA82648.1 peptidase [Aureimonas sp. SA4125]